LSGKITSEFDPSVPMTAGMAMMGIGLFVLALIPVNDSLVVIEAALLVIGCGAQELLNSFFCLFCKALRVLDRVSVSNINWQDP
jgi:hypothetical protein